MTTNKSIINWIEKMREIVKPDKMNSLQLCLVGPKNKFLLLER